MRIHTAPAFRLLPPAVHTALSGPLCSPFFNADFLGLLESTGCVNAKTGWQPLHLWIEHAGNPVFYLPIYVKSHSWGEFVFDQRWAQFYEDQGRRYYPKWVSCIPFTPSVGPRWWVAPDANENELLSLALSFIGERLQAGVSSGWHLLFADKTPPAIHLSTRLLSRHDTQFHWFNQGYSCFDDYLVRLKSRKRKKIRRERERVAEQGVTLRRREGYALTPQDWATFYRCYSSTYYLRGQTPYLTEAFFMAMAQVRSAQIMMVQAFQDDEMIAGALCFHDQSTLYGRHWGALREVDCLHFEACFYQGIEYCIEHGLQRFDPGTQGEHKLLRGFEPVQTTSWHWIADTRFRDAIAHYLEWEKSRNQRYFEAAGAWLPYKIDPADTSD